MSANETSIKLNIENLDEAIEKVNRLVEALREAKKIADSISDTGDEIVKVDKVPKNGCKSGWYGRFYTNNPAETAYKIILLLEKERIPRMCVDEILKAVKSILDFQEVIHTSRDEENPSFPK